MIDRARQALRSSWPWLLLAGALALWFFAGRGGGTLLPEGEAAPRLEIPWNGGAADEAAFSLEDQRGRVVVLAFWATWCPACRREGPTLSRVHERIAPAGDRVIGVSVDRGSLQDIGRAAERLGMRYPIAQATREDTARFGVELLPTVYVVGPDGRVRASFTGGVGEEQLVEAVEAARDDAVARR